MPLSTTACAIIFGYFFVILILSKFKSRVFSGKTITLLRAFFPSWKFFEDVSEVPILFCRTGRHGGELGNWQPCLEKIPRSLGNFFLNATGNQILAFGSLLQHLAQDLENADETRPQDFEQTVTYRLTKNLVVHLLQDKILKREIQKYQFKVSAVFPGTDLIANASDDILVSRVYEV